MSRSTCTTKHLSELIHGVGHSVTEVHTHTHTHTQLFDFDLEVHPILEVLVGKTVEQSLLEVMEEEELANLRAQQVRSLAHYNMRQVVYIHGYPAYQGVTVMLHW